MKNLWLLLGVGGVGFLLWRKAKRKEILTHLMSALQEGARVDELRAARAAAARTPMVDTGPPPLATDETVAGMPAPFVPQNIPDLDPRVTTITLANQAQTFQKSARFTARPTVIEEPVVGRFITAKGRMLGDGLAVACSPMASAYANMAADVGYGPDHTDGDKRAMRRILGLVKRADCRGADLAALLLTKVMAKRQRKVGGGRRLGRRSVPGRGKGDWVSRGGAEWHQVAGLGAVVSESPFFQQYGDRRRGYAFTPGADQYFSPTSQAGQNGFAGVFGAPVFSSPAIPMQKKLPVGVEHAGWFGPQFNTISTPPNWPGASV